jgi:hypothetical protein
MASIGVLQSILGFDPNMKLWKTKKKIGKKEKPLIN